MIGITEDHEFKTRDGWKFFHEIDIKKDELYCWRFKVIDDDPCGLWYCDSYEQNGNQITDSANFYISPEQKCFYSKNDCDLFQIKNNYIDTIVTSNYSMPIVMESYENRYDNSSNLKPLTFIYEHVYSSEQSDTEEEFGVSAFTETLINHNPPHKWYGWQDLMFKLKLSHFERLTTRDKKIVCFSMPELIDKNVSWRVYVRRYGKEFWL
jgi:hypothetical protein